MLIWGHGRDVQNSTDLGGQDDCEKAGAVPGYDSDDMLRRSPGGVGLRSGSVSPRRLPPIELPRPMSRGA